MCVCGVCVGRGGVESVDWGWLWCGVRVVVGVRGWAGTDVGVGWKCVSLAGELTTTLFLEQLLALDLIEWDLLLSPSTSIYVSSYCYMCVRILLYVSAYCYMCVLMLLYMCPHTATYVSSYCYICVLILPYI